MYVLTANGTHYTQGSPLVDSQSMSSRTMVLITRKGASRGLPTYVLTDTGTHYPHGSLLWTPNICPHGQWYSLPTLQPPCGLPIYVLTDNGTHYPHDCLIVDSRSMSSRTMELITRTEASLWTPKLCPHGQWYT